VPENEYDANVQLAVPMLKYGAEPVAVVVPDDIDPVAPDTVTVIDVP
jgi:hypothetical protein